jgi:hypothetical protein
MICTECQHRLSDFIDGHLSPGEKLRMQEHLSSCNGCNVIHQDLSLIVTTSRDLPIHNPSNVWQRIQLEIGQTTTVNSHRRAAGWWGRRFQINLGLPQLAVAACLVIAITVSIGVISRFSPKSLPGVYFSWTSPEVSPAALSTTTAAAAPVDVAKSIADYDGQVRQRMSTWDPRMRDTFERNMAVINLCLEKMQRELAADPSNDVSRDLLHSTYDKKLKLLQDFSEF